MEVLDRDMALFSGAGVREMARSTCGGGGMGDACYNYTHAFTSSLVY